MFTFRGLGDQRLPAPAKHPPAAWLALLAVALLSGAGAAAQNAETGGAMRSAPVDLPEAVLDRYTGDYLLGERLVMHITRQGGQLFAQLDGQAISPIYPESASAFVYHVADAQIDFIPDPPLQITALVFHQHGTDYIAQRIDLSGAGQPDAGVARRVQQQVAAAGSEQAARLLLAGLALGAPDYSSMTPQLADSMRSQLPQLRDQLAQLGPVRSISFQGVGSQGWDLYRVRHENGSSELRILMSADGKLAGALLSAGP